MPDSSLYCYNCGHTPSAELNEAIDFIYNFRPRQNELLKEVAEHNRRRVGLDVPTDQAVEKCQKGDFEMARKGWDLPSCFRLATNVGKVRKGTHNPRIHAENQKGA